MAISEELRKKLRVRLGLAGVFVFLVLPGAYTTACLNFTYSSGERVGYVQKLSKRGWVCKTYEGELAMTVVPGQPAQTFLFTVLDPVVAEEINKLSGQRVALSYDEHRGVPSNCFGDTGYFVRGVKTLNAPF